MQFDPDGGWSAERRARAAVNAARSAIIADRPDNCLRYSLRETQPDSHECRTVRDVICDNCLTASA
jgi:hypothetical protein